MKRVTIAAMIMAGPEGATYGVYTDAPTRKRKGRIVAVDLNRARRVACYSYPAGISPDYFELASWHDSPTAPAFAF